MDKGPGARRVTDQSRDGRYLIEDVVEPETVGGIRLNLEVTDANANVDIWVIPALGDRKPFPYINTDFQESKGKLSSSGQLLAYVSNESNRNEVYVQSFPEHGGKWQVSTGGGDFPVWSRDGREVYFISADNKMMAVEVKGDSRKLAFGAPHVLFSVPERAQFDVSKDGRFLIKIPQNRDARDVPMTVVVNWQAGLKK